MMVAKGVEYRRQVQLGAEISWRRLDGGAVCLGRIGQPAEGTQDDSPGIVRVGKRGCSGDRLIEQSKGCVIFTHQVTRRCGQVEDCRVAGDYRKKGIAQAENICHVASLKAL